jgi:putative PIN family toxin of toxin-antitoxin system
MIALLDSNLFISALISPHGAPGLIYDAWLQDRFRVVTCQEQIDEIRAACRNVKFKDRLQPHHVGTMLNNLYGASVWPASLPHRHEAADPTDRFLLDLIEAAQPEYAVTGDKCSGLLQLDKLGRTKILKASAFCAEVLHL